MPGAPVAWRAPCGAVERPPSGSPGFQCVARVWRRSAARPGRACRAVSRPPLRLSSSASPFSAFSARLACCSTHSVCLTAVCRALRAPSTPRVETPLAFACHAAARPMLAAHALRDHRLVTRSARHPAATSAPGTGDPYSVLRGSWGPPRECARGAVDEPVQDPVLLLLGKMRIAAKAVFIRIDPTLLRLLHPLSSPVVIVRHPST
jgi:hypothetical protein